MAKLLRASARSRRSAHRHSTTTNTERAHGCTAIMRLQYSPSLRWLRHSSSVHALRLRTRTQHTPRPRTYLSTATTTKKTNTGHRCALVACIFGAAMRVKGMRSVPPLPLPRAHRSPPPFFFLAGRLLARERNASTWLQHETKRLCGGGGVSRCCWIWRGACCASR